MKEMYNKNNPQMLNSAVCFVDILGFSSMIEQSCKENNGNRILNRLCSRIKNSIEFIKPTTEVLGTIKIFTDSVVIGKPIFDDGESELGQIFLGFASYQLSLALEGFFVRGGVSIGDYYANEDISFGPALLEAHNIESCVAKTHRIVLSQDSKKMVKHHLTYYPSISYASQVNDIFEDIDGEWFVNYLEAAFQDRDEAGYWHAQKIMEQHRDMVIRKISQYKRDQEVLNKYEWVAQYHNHFCNLNFPKCGDLLIQGFNSSGRFKFISQ